MIGRAAIDRAPLDRGRNMVKFVMSGRRVMAAILESHYVSAGALASRLGLGDRVRNAAHHTFERWDGTGLPRGIRGEAIPIEMRIVQLADVAEVHLRRGGADAAVAVAKKRSGTHFEPHIASVLAAHSTETLADLTDDDAWRAALEQAPQPDHLTTSELDELLLAVGDFVDLKSPFRHGPLQGCHLTGG